MKCPAVRETPRADHHLTRQVNNDMTNISEFRRDTLVVSAPPIQEPEEFDPIELLRLFQYYYNFSTEQFATCFGCEVDTIYKWAQKRKCCKLARIRAADLKRERGI